MPTITSTDYTGRLKLGSVRANSPTSALSFCFVFFTLVDVKEGLLFITMCHSIFCTCMHQYSTVIIGPESELYKFENIVHKLCEFLRVPVNFEIKYGKLAIFWKLPLKTCTKCSVWSMVNRFRLHCVQKKKHPLTFSSISPWVMCRFKQK